MNEQVSATSVEKSLLQDWVEEETRHLDVVASWEVLCNTYDDLRFNDPISDTARLEEFKWIIKQTNAFLTRMQKQLRSCRTYDAAIQCLLNNMIPTGKTEIDQRRALAFQKFRLTWIQRAIMQLDQLQQMEQMKEGAINGWTDFADE